MYAIRSYYDGEIRRGQHAEVLAILVVDALDALCDDHLDPRHELRIRALLAAAALAAALPRDRANEAPVLHRRARDRVVGLARVAVRGTQPQVREVAERLVEEVADVV